MNNIPEIPLAPADDEEDDNVFDGSLEDNVESQKKNAPSTTRKSTAKKHKSNHDEDRSSVFMEILQHLKKNDKENKLFRLEHRLANEESRLITLEDHIRKSQGWVFSVKRELIEKKDWI